MWRTCAVFVCIVIICGVGAFATIYVPDEWFKHITPEDTPAKEHVKLQSHTQHNSSFNIEFQHNSTIIETQHNSSIPYKEKTETAQRVTVDFYVMSKCPDAQVCITNFQPAIASISSIADISVNYIASYIIPDQFQCMHGPTECAGNLQQICAEYLFPNVTKTGSLTFFDFMACQEQTRTNIPDNGQPCAQQTGIDWDELNSCATGPQGITYLADSIARTNAAKQTVSCTININSAFWCQHNGPWVNCNEGSTPDDLVKSVCKRYQGADKPAACSQ